MIQKAKALVTAGLLAAFCRMPVRGQAPPPTILTIDVENYVLYRDDVTDISKLATDPNVTSTVIPRNFQWSLAISDIVAVNGQSAKGTWVQHSRTLNLSPNPSPGQAIADMVRGGIGPQTMEISKSDGSPIGTLMVLGVGGQGSPPPGAPLAATQANNAIVGGTGAFVGARGIVSFQAFASPPRQASMAEDPANRRQNGGGKARVLFTVIPMTVPQIMITSGGPAVTHSSDFSLVTASKPAAAGEILSLFVTGLGPTKPGVDPGKPFPTSPPSVVNSPVDVTVNGKSAEVTAAVGYPGSVDGYQVNFRVPSDAAKGTATVQVTAAWIAGSAANITIQ